MKLRIGFFITVYIITFDLIAQRQPLARQDSALLIKYREGYEARKASGDLRGASDFLNKIALTFWNHNQYPEAIKEYENSLKLNEELGNENGIAMISNNLGMLYADIKDYDKSIQSFNRTLAGRRSQKEKIGIISALINRSVVFNNRSQFDSSIISLEEALTLAREMNDEKQMKSCYGMLSETYEKQGDVEKSFQYFELYRTFHKMVQRKREAKFQQTAEEANLRAKLAEFEKRNKELEVIAKEKQLEEKKEELDNYEFANEQIFSLLSEKEIRLKVVEQEAELKELRLKEAEIVAQRNEERATTIRNYFIGVFILIATVTLLIYRNNRQKKKANEELTIQNGKILNQKEELVARGLKLNNANKLISIKNKKITNSINYARRIQSAMLKRTKNMKEFLPNSFMFLQPKDVVSGDFYWYEKIDDKLIIAAVDCTGHGVPSAFMSLIGVSLLEQIVVAEREHNPEKILTKLHHGIVKSLQQEHSENKDGMDAAICTLDLKENKLLYAGAKRPLVYIEDKKVYSIKGTISGIGGIFGAHTPKSFEVHELSTVGKKFYLFSDGYADQFGGIRNRKFLQKKMMNTILATSKYDFDKQKELLKKEWEDWKGDGSQTDDILVIGFSN